MELAGDKRAPRIGNRAIPTVVLGTIGNVRLPLTSPSETIGRYAITGASESKPAQRSSSRVRPFFNSPKQPNGQNSTAQEFHWLLAFNGQATTAQEFHWLLAFVGCRSSFGTPLPSLVGGST
jgi:hypothetical protein